MQLQALARSFDYQIFIINESWLNINISDTLILDSSFDIFRCDRKSTSANNGGGVFIAAKTILNASLIYKNNSRGFETCWIKTKFYNRYIIVGTIYAHPRLNKKTWLQEFENILNQVLLQYPND